MKYIYFYSFLDSILNTCKYMCQGYFLLTNSDLTNSLIGTQHLFFKSGGWVVDSSKQIFTCKKGGGALFSSTHENLNPWGEGGSVPITLISLFVYFLLPQFFNTPKTTSWQEGKERSVHNFNYIIYSLLFTSIFMFLKLGLQLHVFFTFLNR